MSRAHFAVLAALVVACRTDSVGADQPALFENLGQLDGTTWVKHDPVRHVTCWEFYYERYVSVSFGYSAGGISCLPDKEVSP